MTETANKKLRLLALENADIEVISAACQDAIFLPKDIQFIKKQRRFIIPLQRYCHEISDKALRTVAILSFDGVLGVSAKEIVQTSKMPYSIMNIGFKETEAPSGEFTIDLAHGGKFLISVECIDIVLGDIGEIRTAVRPDHELE